jgi:hypothetical protein
MSSSSSSSSSLVPPPPALSPRTAGRGGANTPAAIGLIGLVLALLALALDSLSLSNRLYALGLGAVDNLIPVAVAIAAVVVGHIALAQAGRFPAGRGRRGLALTAVALGYLSLVVFLAFIGLLLYAFFTSG